MKDISVRYASPEDAEACQAFNQQMGCPDNLVDKIKRQEIIIATLPAEIAGYMRMEMLWNAIPFISWIYIQEEYRGQGIGAALLRFIEMELGAPRYKNPQWLLSSSKTTNTRSIEWHKRRDFVPCGYWEGTHTDGSNEVFFKKSLQVENG